MDVNFPQSLNVIVGSFRPLLRVDSEEFVCPILRLLRNKWILHSALRLVA
jgi:hypothetical protein